MSRSNHAAPLESGAKAVPVRRCFCLELGDAAFWRHEVVQTQLSRHRPARRDLFGPGGPSGRLSPGTTQARWRAHSPFGRRAPGRRPPNETAAQTNTAGPPQRPFSQAESRKEEIHQVAHQSESPGRRRRTAAAPPRAYAPRATARGSPPTSRATFCPRTPTAYRRCTGLTTPARSTPSRQVRSSSAGPAAASIPRSNGLPSFFP